MCFLALLYATHRSRTSPAWIGLMVAAFCGLVLLKGAFAMFALVAAVLWLLLVPMPPGGANRWPWAGLVLTVFVAAVMVAGYEGLYVRATGESFLDFYRSRRLGDSIRMTDVAVVSHALVNVGWYLTRLAWFAAPWSLIAIPAAVGWARSKGTRDKGQGKDLLTERALLWAMLLTAAYIAVLSPALVRAERFIFPTYFVIGAVGAVTAMRNVDAVRRVAVSAEPHSWLPVAVWFGTFVLSLGSRIVRL
jgi:hypothetical protein